MKHTRKDLEKGKIEYRIEVASEDVAEHHAAAIKKLSGDVKVAGFRQGHVPPEVAAKHVDQAKLADEAINTAINAALVELIRLEQLQLLDRPDISITKFVPAQVLEFTAVIQIVPSVKLADVFKLKTKKSLVKITDKEIDEVIERLRGESATKKEVKRAAKISDEVIIDFTGMKNGVEFDGGKATDYALKLGSNSFIPGFEEGIIGKKAGDEFDLPLTFPEDYGAQNLAGQAVQFKIVLKKVQEVKLPALDDKFASQIAPDIKTLADLKKDIKKELTARAEYEAERKFQDDLLTELTEKSKVEAPEILIEDQLVALERQFGENLTYRGMTLDTYLEQEKLTHDEWIAKELRPAAEKRVRTSLVMAQLTRDWNITVTDEEVTAQQEKIISQYNDPNLRQHFETPEARQQIAQQMMAEKTLHRLATIVTN
ncbi:trigger factor [Candidatus Saccharibacteria bacterium]|nr:trigger factor [Candidatus Saccharibacteria bacterium]